MDDFVPVIGIERHRLLTDGRGVTTLVAFHGCPLHCKYCLNPHCLKDDICCKWYDCELLYDEVKIDELYFIATCGGITFGGGEPCLQSEFIRDFRKLCGNGWRITVETSLNVPLKHLELLLPVVDHYVIDIKDMNNEIYRRYTGKDNRQVIDNLEWLINRGKADFITVRVPLIPSYNSESDIEDSLRQLRLFGLSDFDLFTYRT